jgi:hypothetical protein
MQVACRSRLVRARSYRIVVRGSAWEAASCTSRSGTPASKLRGGDERMAKGVVPDGFGDPGAAGGPADNPGGAVPVQLPPVSGQKDRPVGTFADGKVDRPGGARGQWDGDHLAAFAGDHQGAVPALDPQSLDVGAGGFGHPQPIERQQRDQRVAGGWPEPGRHQQRAEFIAVQPDRVGLVVQPRSPDVRCRRMLQQFLFHRVTVEPGHRAQPTGDSGPGPAAGFQVAGEAFDVGAAGLEKAQMVLLAPGRVLAKIQLVGWRVSPLYPARNPANASRSVLVNTGVTGTSTAAEVVALMGTSLDRG